MTVFVVYRLDTRKAGGEYRILTIDEAYHWIQSGGTNLLRVKDSLKEINIPEIKEMLKHEKILELLNQQGDRWLITRVIE